MPAYTCPDVVSAVLWAGARPVLIDTCPDKPWLDEEALAESRDDTWAAVIAPHFLGLAHPTEALQCWCRDHGLALIEDSAQMSPWSPAFAPRGDFVILSFGRGKPIAAGGGALLVSEEYVARALEILNPLPESGKRASTWHARAMLLDMALSRPGYRLVELLPWLHVGETHYRPLAQPKRLGSAWIRRAENVIAGRRDHVAAAMPGIREAVAASDFTDVPQSCGWNPGQTLLRYPVLAPTTERCRRVAMELEARRMGVSRLYGRILVDLDGMPDLDMNAAYVNARSFAARLLTFPVHSGVSAKHIDAFRSALGH